jgi:TonB family protein
VLLRLAALSALMFSSAAPAADTPKQPTGKWIVHFEDAQCVAQRDYGSTNHPLILLLKQPPLGGVMQISIIEKGTVAEATQLDATYQFDSQPQQKVSILRFSPKGQGTRVAMMNLSQEQFAAGRQSQSLRLDYAAFHARLALLQFPELLEIMNACVADLRKVWNVRPAGEEAASVRKDARGDLRGLFSSDDYPADSLRFGESGSVKVALLVDEQGKVADCSVTETSGAAILDAQSCAILRERAKFTPAVGKDGKPAKDAWIQQISWRLG